MKTIPCAKCGYQMSTYAANCLECGHPRQFPNTDPIGPRCYACTAPATTRCNICGTFSCPVHVEPNGYRGGLKCSSCRESEANQMFWLWIFIGFVVLIMGTCMALAPPKNNNPPPRIDIRTEIEPRAWGDNRPPRVRWRVDGKLLPPDQEPDAKKP